MRKSFGQAWRCKHESHLGFRVGFEAVDETPKERKGPGDPGTRSGTLTLRGGRVRNPPAQENGVAGGKAL